MVEVKEEKKEWIPIPNNSGRWIPEKPGDELIGVYLERKPAPYKGRENYKYLFESDNKDAVDGVVLVYGTDGLNSAMDKIPVKTKLKILYDGERPPGDPMKKPFKLFKVCYYGSKGDDLYKKLYPDDGNENKVKSGNTLAASEDKEARNTIDNYIEILKSQYQKVTCESIIEMASSDPDLKPADLTRIKVQLVEDVRAGKLISVKQKGEK